jgi:hypothetical protein
LPATRDVILEELFGIRQQVAPDEALKIGKALLIIAGCDGLPESELEYALSVARLFGAEREQIEALRRFDYKRADLEHYLTPGGIAPPRVLLHLAIRVTRADGTYSTAERAAIARGAELLGVESSGVTALEALCDLEDALRRTRIAMVYP